MSYMNLAVLCLLIINLQLLTCTKYIQFFIKYTCYTCRALLISACTKRKIGEITTNINDNMQALQHTITKRSEIYTVIQKKIPAVKKGVAPKKAIVKKDMISKVAAKKWL